MPALTDAQLVERCRAGDDGAWLELVQRFSRYVHAIATGPFRLTGPDAEDVFQEVFARTYEHLDRLRDDAAIRPWIAQLTRRLAIDRLRAGAREQPAYHAVPEPAEADAAIERLGEALEVREALAGVGEPCVELLDRFFARDESYATIASALALPAGTVASRMSRCLAKLRERLEGSGWTARAS